MHDGGGEGKREKKQKMKTTKKNHDREKRPK